MERFAALKVLDIKPLMKGELIALEGYSAGSPGLRDFVLAEFHAAEGYYDALVMATRMAARGELDRDVAERFRYPRAYWNLIEREARRNGLESYLVLALARQESLFNPAARSISDARGLMQLLPSTARKIALGNGMASDDLNLYDPVLNIRLGTDYLKDLVQMFGGDRFRAVAAYNAGEHAVERWNRRSPLEDDEWVENIGYRETRDYVKKVIGGLREYRLLYGSGASG